jgi:probable rRNA maturation factor
VTVTVVARVPRPGITPSRLRRLLRHVLRREGAPASASLTVVLTSDREIRRLNRRFLGKDRPTDVLAFPAEDGFLGDVVVSVNRARAQAQVAGHAVATEVAFLASHGALHLLGHDDRTPRRRAAMLRRQRVLLGEVGVRVTG